MKILAIIILLTASTLSAAPLVFWDFNSNSLAPTMGSATTTATYSGLGTGTISYLTGTTENAPAGVLAGNALGWSGFIEIFSTATFQATSLNLSGFNNIQLSFALNTDHTFQVGESLNIYTNTGSGWHLQETLSNPALNVWQVYNANLPSLDNGSNVGFRVVASTTVGIGKFLAIDNMSIIPEPKVGYFIIFVGCFLILFKNRLNHRKNTA